MLRSKEPNCVGLSSTEERAETKRSIIASKILFYVLFCLASHKLKETAYRSTTGKNATCIYFSSHIIPITYKTYAIFNHRCYHGRSRLNWCLSKLLYVVEDCMYVYIFSISLKDDALPNVGFVSYT